MSRSKILKSQQQAAFDVTTDFPDLGLHRAAATGDVGLATYALSHGQPVNSVLDGVLPLHAACSVGNEPVVQLLIDHGADVNAPQLPRRHTDKSRGSSSSSAPVVGGEGATPLHFAAANGHIHIARLLLRCGARADRVDKHGTTPDMLAAAAHPETAALLRKWMDGQDADLRFRAEAIGTSSKGGGYSSRGFSFGSSACETPTREDQGSTSKKLHVRASMERLFRHNPASASSSAMPTPSGEPGYPEGFDPTARRPSLPHTQPTSFGRRPRSAGTGASDPNSNEPYNTMTASNGPSTPVSKPRTKRSLLSLLRKTSDEPSSPGPGSSPPVTRTGFMGERRLSGASLTSNASALPMMTPPPPPRAPLPTALEMHHALTRNRSGSGASSVEGVSPMPAGPGRRAHGRAGSMSDASQHSGRGWARTLSPARGLKGSGSVTSLRGIDERGVLPSEDISPGSRPSPRGNGKGTDIEEETEESDEEEEEYGLPLSHKDRIFAPSSLGREIDVDQDEDLDVEAPSPLDAPVRPFAGGNGDGRERGGSVSSAATAGTTNTTSSSNVAASTVATSVGSPGYASTMSLFPGTTGPSSTTSESSSANTTTAAPLTQRRALGSAGSALGLGIDLSTISSPEEATAAVQRAQASILALSTAPDGPAQTPQEEELTSPVLDVEGLTLSPLSARLAAYGETLAMERRLKSRNNPLPAVPNVNTSNLERRGSLDRTPSGRAREDSERVMIKKALKAGSGAPTSGSGGKRPKRPHTANAETRAWEGGEGSMRGPSRLGVFSSSSSGDSGTSRFGRSISDQPPQAHGYGRTQHSGSRPSPLDLGRTQPLTEPVVPTVGSEKIQEVEIQQSKALPLQTPAIVETCATPVLGHGFPSPRTAQPPNGHNHLPQPLSPRTRVPSAPAPPGAPCSPQATRATSHNVRHLPPQTQDTASDSGLEDDDPRFGLTPRVDIDPASGASDFDSNASNASTRSSLDVPPYSGTTPLSASASKQSFGFGTQLSRVTTSPGALAGGGSASTPMLAQNVKSATKLARMGFGGSGSAGSSGPGTPRAVGGGASKELGAGSQREGKKFGLRSLVAGLKGR